MYPVVKVNSRIKVGQKSDIIEIENSIKWQLSDRGDVKKYSTVSL